MKTSFKIYCFLVHASLFVLFQVNAGAIVPTSTDTSLRVLNFRVDSLTLTGSWEFPGIILLDEHFEDSGTLPPGWGSVSSEAPAWIWTDDGTSMNFLVNRHGHYMISNDFNAGQYHNGCCDRLITPPINLSLTDSTNLTFESCYSGAFNEKAIVEISIDGGQTWQILRTLDPPTGFDGEWIKECVDLTTYTGLPGSDSALICFHADDNGQQASGWAVDDILIKALATGVQGYSLWLDDNFTGTASDLSWQFDPISLLYGSSHLAEVAVNYPTGASLRDSVKFNDRYLPYPDSLTGWANMNLFNVSWVPPDFGNSGLQDDFLFYRLYVNDTLLATISPDEVEYSFYIPESGNYCLKLVAVYDISSLGFPGQIVESHPAGPGCYNIFYCCSLPFFEDWTAGSYGLNNWTYDDHWIITMDEGLAAPSARFNSLPGIDDYAESLVMFPRLTAESTATPHDVFLDFDLKLADIQASETEKLTFFWKIQGAEWDTIVQFSNSGSFDWTHYTFRLGAPYQLSVICFKVAASGENSENIDHWLLDNIKLEIMWGFNAPLELIATPEPGLQRVRLEWTTPSDTVIYKSGAGISDLLGYSVFRRSRYPDPGDWVKIGNTTTTWFEDENLPKNCYDYYVTAVYNESFATSNIDSLNCTDVGIPEASGNDAILNFNPGTGLVTVSTNIPVNQVELYDMTGKSLLRRSPGKTGMFSIDLNAYPAGIYLIRVIDINGGVTLNRIIRS